MNRSDSVILQLLHTPRIGPKTLERILAAAEEARVDLEDLAAGSSGLLRKLGLKPAQLEALENSPADVAALCEQLEQHDVRLLVKGRAGYPAALNRNAKELAPPVLFARGPADILARKAVAFCGSRHASVLGLHLTQACAGEVARHGGNVVSGYANGVDLAAHVGALAAGGVTTLVLAEGILRFRSKPEIGALLTESNHLVLSQFPPRLSWSVGNAMQRNTTVLGLADAVVVVESGLEGGTFAAAESALAMSRPLFVVDYPDPPPSAAGNCHFLERGATAVHLHADGSPDLTELFRVIESPWPTGDSVDPTPMQRGLFDALEGAS